MDNSLLLKAVDGDEAAYKDVMLATVPTIKATMYSNRSLMGNSFDSMPDAVNSFLSDRWADLMNAYNPDSDECTFETYVAACVLNYLRNVKRKSEAKKRDATIISVGGTKDVEALSPDQPENVRLTVDKSLLYDCIDTLSDDDKTIICMFYGLGDFEEGMDKVEMARKLGVAKPTMYNRLGTAMANLRSIMMATA